MEQKRREEKRGEERKGEERGEYFNVNERKE